MAEHEPSWWEEQQEATLIVGLGDRFNPFSGGIIEIEKPDYRMGPVAGAIGYSAPFIVDDLDALGRIELYHDLGSLTKPYSANIFPPNHQRHYYHGIIPVIAKPVLFFDDPDTAEANVMCIIGKPSKKFYACNIPLIDFNEVATFDSWKEYNTGDSTPLKFDDEIDLKLSSFCFKKTPRLLRSQNNW